MPDSPHDITIVIPVADRPQHLADCLASLQELRHHYPYAGEVRVLVADDSRETDHIERHRALAAHYSAAGLPVEHFDQAQQRALRDGIVPELRAQLADVLGTHAPEAFHHKGAAVTRNLAYLWLNRQAQDGRRRLFWFIDSDQEFRVNIATDSGEEERYAIDYFHWLDYLFSTTPARVVTGKVVGDPPVSPAVMAGNFLDDVTAFLHAMAACVPEAACAFHAARRHADDAAYHDMADLFGFKAAEAFRYHCGLSGPHGNAHCFSDFAARLARFFDGEHPTRRSVYQPGDLLASVAPARTIYSGNYVISAEGLEYFIPFAALKLRMAGPTLGRIIKAELGACFVSANLPMLHRRTVAASGQAEFRPGIERGPGHVDLSGEFERQYFGDVMLFAMERMAVAPAARGAHPAMESPSVGCAPRTNTEPHVPPPTLPDKDVIAHIVDEVEAQMHERYGTKHRAVVEKMAALQALYTAPGQWWHNATALTEARKKFEQFIADMQHNFGDSSRAWQLINDGAHRQARKAAIVAAIAAYPAQRHAWRAALAAARSETT
jgi:hypothetical protein